MFFVKKFSRRFFNENFSGESKMLEEFLEEHDMIRGIKSLPQCQGQDLILFKV